jgi:carboxypeptidase C (cathepsin A)
MKHPFPILVLCVFSFASIPLSANEKPQVKKSYLQPDLAITQHVFQAGSQKFSYQATAGHMTLLNDKGEERAQFFHVSYTKTGQVSLATRPITFVFNGGPGSSSVWLHMGALGPKIIKMQDNSLAGSPPYTLLDNPHSWLDKTDLVFIDPIETGYSRPAEGVDKAEFTGYNEDIQSIGDFIHKYVTQHGRWASPKFLAGESYGTTRAVGLSGYLQDRHGLYLNGVVLISAVLNFQTLAFSGGNELPYALFLPSFAATAYHHGKIDKKKYPDFQSFLREVELFAEKDYNYLLMKGDRITPDEADLLLTKLMQYTGLNAACIRAYQYRISTQVFTKELLRDSSFTIGRFDGTIKGKDKLSAGVSYEFDPSYNLSIFGAYTAAINMHLSANLNYRNADKVYEILTGKVHPWNYNNVQNKFLDNSDVMRAAIHKNPHLKVLVCSGYYDLATPYFATDYTLSHLFLAPEWKDNIQVKYYKGGHMMYTYPHLLKEFATDVKAFYDAFSFK